MTSGEAEGDVVTLLDRVADAERDWDRVGCAVREPETDVVDVRVSRGVRDPVLDEVGLWDTDADTESVAHEGVGVADLTADVDACAVNVTFGEAVKETEKVAELADERDGRLLREDDGDAVEDDDGIEVALSVGMLAFDVPLELGEVLVEPVALSDAAPERDAEDDVVLEMDETDDSVAKLLEEDVGEDDCVSALETVAPETEGAPVALCVTLADVVAVSVAHGDTVGVTVDDPTARLALGLLVDELLQQSVAVADGLAVDVTLTSGDLVDENVVTEVLLRFGDALLDALPVEDRVREGEPVPLPDVLKLRDALALRRGLREPEDDVVAEDEGERDRVRKDVPLGVLVDVTHAEVDVLTETDEAPLNDRMLVSVKSPVFVEVAVVDKYDETDALPLDVNVPVSVKTRERVALVEGENVLEDVALEDFEAEALREGVLLPEGDFETVLLADARELTESVAREVAVADALDRDVRERSPLREDVPDNVMTLVTDTDAVELKLVPLEVDATPDTVPLNVTDGEFVEQRVGNEEKDADGDEEGERLLLVDFEVVEERVASFEGLLELDAHMDTDAEGVADTSAVTVWEERVVAEEREEKEGTAEVDTDTVGVREPRGEKDGEGVRECAEEGEARRLSDTVTDEHALLDRVVVDVIESVVEPQVVVV